MLKKVSNIVLLIILVTMLGMTVPKIIANSFPAIGQESMIK
ncbi:hypothetical protein [Clostridium tetani]|nr:hypothetical protein [Clostridium tetani]CDI50730.1 hypothetical protein BN906_02768 [Clostridium tetani 12124569]